MSSYNGYFGIAAWSIVILLFILAARTKIGYTLLMYFCVASIIIVLAVGSPTLVNIFSNANTTPTDQPVPVPPKKGVI